MNISEKSVFQVLSAVGEEGLTVKEILLALNQRMKKKAQLRKALRRLAEKNLTFKKNNRYFLKDPSGSVPASLQKGSGRTATPKSGRKKQRYPEGIFLKKQGKPVMIVENGEKTLPVAPGEERWLLHGDRVRFSLKQNRNRRDVALPLEITARPIRLLKGRMEKGARGECFFRPLNPVFPKRIKVLNPPRRFEQGASVGFLEITRFDSGTRYPEGRIDFSLSGDRAENAVIEQILAENRIPLHFPRAVLNEASRYPQIVRCKAEENRRDLRSLPFITIDGAEARDFDDAIYARKEKNTYRIWISIADVAAYVLRKTKIDDEARTRGTSTYLPARAIPMLPPALSSGLCSLKAGRNRKTITSEIQLDKNGNVLSAEIYESMNRISRRLTYDQVDHFFQSGELSGKRDVESLQQLLLVAAEISTILEKKRLKRGAIDFQMPDTEFAFDPENRVSGIGKIYQSKAMRLIEQFMLEANEAVARFCDEQRIPIIWRNHPQPAPEKINRLKQLFWNNNLKVQGLREPGDFNRALRKCRHHPSRELLEYSILRTMSLAGYGIEREGHFGLAATHYCHFTSPIRRYPDLIVHRAVKACLKGKRPLKLSERLADDLSDRERKAANAERAAVRFTKALFLSERIGDVMRVRISGFHWKGVFVEVNEPYAEGFLDFATMTDDRYHYDERNQVVVGEKTGRIVPFASELDALLSGLDKRQFTPEFTWIRWDER